MKYKVGDKVYLRDDLEVGKKYGGLDIPEKWIDRYTNKELEITRVFTRLNDNTNFDFYVKYGFLFTEEMIDHEKTAQLSTDTQDEKPDNVVCMTEKEVMGDKEVMDDMVNHPKHYTQGEIETIDKIKYLTEDFSGIEAVCIGNFIKYIDRCNLKGGMQDLEKAKWYLDRFLDEFYDDIIG